MKRWERLLSLVSCERAFRWWRPALHLFRRRFLVSDWGGRCVEFPGRSAFSGTCTLGGRSPLRRRVTFGTCLALGGSTSFCSRPPFGSCPALHWRPLFPGRACGRRTFLTLRHMLPPESRITLSFPPKEGTLRRAQPRIKPGSYSANGPASLPR
jgi:hypothetical protein